MIMGRRNNRATVGNNFWRNLMSDDRENDDEAPSCDYTHRYLCSVLAEAVDIINHTRYYNVRRNRAILLSLVDEIQVYANRMEAALGYGSDLKELHEKRAELNKSLAILHKQKKALEGKVKVKPKKTPSKDKKDEDT